MFNVITLGTRLIAISVRSTTLGLSLCSARGLLQWSASWSLYHGCRIRKRDGFQRANIQRINPRARIYNSSADPIQGSNMMIMSHIATVACAACPSRPLCSSAGPTSLAVAVLLVLAGTSRSETRSASTAMRAPRSAPIL